MFHRPASSFATMAARYWRSSMVASGWVAAHTRAAMHMVSRNDGSWLLTAFMKSALSIGGFSNNRSSSSVHRCSEDGEVIVRTERKVFRESRKGGNEHT